MADITTDKQVVDLIVQTISSNPDMSLREAAKLAVRRMRADGALVSGVVDELHKLKDLAERAFGCECEAAAKISTNPDCANVIVRYAINGHSSYIFGYGASWRECFEDARRQLQETLNKHTQEYRDLCATLGITPDGRIIDEAA